MIVEKKALKLYKPTLQQLQIHNCKSQFITLIAGRQWGKNYLAHNDKAKKGWENPNSKIWWCAPVFRQAKRDYRRFKSWFPEIICKKWDSELRIELHNGTVIEYYGLEEPENLEGEGLDYLYIDEAGLIKEEAIYNTLLPMLAVKNGKLMIFGKPKGKKSWLYKYYKMGLDEERTDYSSFLYKSSDNPFITAEFLDEMKRVTPHRIFQQEYEAIFLDDGSGVFSNYNNCIIDDELLNSPEPSKQYRIGIDLGKRQDYTVLTVLDIKEKKIVDFKRFNDIDWNIQKKIIIEYCKKWNNAEIIIDSTGVGEPIYDDLLKFGLNIIPFRFTNQSKNNLIENLIVKIQNRDILFPAIPDLLNELELFEYKKTLSGNITYNAPSGKHDDCVISLALCVWNVIEQVDYNKLLLTAFDSDMNDNKFNSMI